MVWISVHTERATTVRAPSAQIFAFLKNIPLAGPLFPGVERIESKGPNEFRWCLQERRMLGRSFLGEYTNLYEDDGVGELRWRTVGGNMKNEGTWRIQATGVEGSMRVRLEFRTEVDAPVPSVLKRPAELFLERETGKGAETMLGRLESAVLAAP